MRQRYPTILHTWPRFHAPTRGHWGGKFEDMAEPMPPICKDAKNNISDTKADTGRTKADTGRKRSLFGSSKNGHGVGKSGVFGGFSEK